VSDEPLVLPPENPEKPKRGGLREPVGGRPRNEVKYKGKIAKATDIMGRMLPEAAAATTDLAKGAYIVMVYNAKAKRWEKPRTLDIAEKSIDAGLFRIYQELPDIRAIMVMFERLMGKVPQPVDITVRQAVQEVTEAQAILMRVIEEHVPEEHLAPIRLELERVAQHHSEARTAVGID
jgi:hypothetical protein